MNKLVILSGVPGSGKSYFSSLLRKNKKGHVYIISSDSLRDMIVGNQQDLSYDEVMWKMFYDLAKVYALDNDGIVVLDATNRNTDLRIKQTTQFQPYFDQIILVYFDIPKAIVYQQNLDREFPVPEQVLDNFYQIIEPPSKDDYQYFHQVYIAKNDNFLEIVHELINK